MGQLGTVLNPGPAGSRWQGGGGGRRKRSSGRRRRAAGSVLGPGAGWGEALGEVCSRAGGSGGGHGLHQGGPRDARPTTALWGGLGSSLLVPSPRPALSPPPPTTHRLPSELLPGVCHDGLAAGLHGRPPALCGRRRRHTVAVHQRGQLHRAAGEGAGCVCGGGERGGEGREGRRGLVARGGGEGAREVGGGSASGHSSRAPPSRPAPGPRSGPACGRAAASARPAQPPPPCKFLTRTRTRTPSGRAGRAGAGPLRRRAGGPHGAGLPGAARLHSGGEGLGV
jgi:hypothetical protein